MAGTDKFKWSDYLMYAISLSIPIVVGIVVAIRSKFLKQSTESYLLANRQLHWLMVAVSMFATVTAGWSIVTLPAELYYRGNKFMWGFPCLIVAYIFAALIMIPKYHRLGFTFISAYEYFEYRYCKPVRVVVGFLSLLERGINSGIILYVPSIVLAHVSHLDIYVCIGLGTIVCSIYTIMGGMKAVVYVDNIQALIMMVGLIGLIVTASNTVGGWLNAWETYTKYGRNNILDIDPSPWKRHTVWNIIFLMGLSFIPTSQSVIQRFMTVGSMRRAQLSYGTSLLANLLMQTIVFIMGVLIFALYGGNDPLLSGKVDKPDEVFPFFIMDMVGSLPGVPGIVVASMYAGALSTMSSSLTAMASTFLEDIARPIHQRLRKRDLSKRACTIVAKCGVLAAGVIIVMISMLLPLLKDSLLTVGFAITSISKGPILGIYAVSFFVPFVESIGLVVGLVVTYAWALMLYVGSLDYATGVGIENLPLYKNNFTETITREPNNNTPTFFDISYTWYVFLDVIVLVVVSCCVSAIVQCKRHRGWKYEAPKKQLLYTRADFLAAIGMTKYGEEENVDNTTKEGFVRHQGLAEHKVDEKEELRENIAYPEPIIEITRF